MTPKQEIAKIDKEVVKLTAKLTPLEKELTVLKNKEHNWNKTGNKLPKYITRDLRRLTLETQGIATEIAGLERRKKEINLQLHMEGVKKQRKPMDYEVGDLYEKLRGLLQIPDPYIISLLIQGAERALQNTAYFKFKRMEKQAEQLQMQRKFGEDTGYSAEDMQFQEFAHDPLIQYEEIRSWLEQLQIVREALRTIHMEAYSDLEAEDIQKHGYDPKFQIFTDEQVAAYWEERWETRRTQAREQQNNAALAAAKADFNAITGK